MKVRELRELLTAGTTLGNDAEVFFYNPDEHEGDPHYPIQGVRFRANFDGEPCCVLADIEE